MPSSIFDLKTKLVLPWTEFSRGEERIDLVL